MKTLLAALLITLSGSSAFAESPGGSYNCTTDFSSLCEGSANPGPAPSPSPSPDAESDDGPDQGSDAGTDADAT